MEFTVALPQQPLLAVAEPGLRGAAPLGQPPKVDGEAAAGERSFELCLELLQRSLPGGEGLPVAGKDLPVLLSNDDTSAPLPLDPALLPHTPVALAAVWATPLPLPPPATPVPDSSSLGEPIAATPRPPAVWPTPAGAAPAISAAAIAGIDDPDPATFSDTATTPSAARAEAARAAMPSNDAADDGVSSPSSTPTPPPTPATAAPSPFTPASEVAAAPVDRATADISAANARAATSPAPSPARSPQVRFSAARDADAEPTSRLQAASTDAPSVLGPAADVPVAGSLLLGTAADAGTVVQPVADAGAPPPLTVTAVGAGEVPRPSAMPVAASTAEQAPVDVHTARWHEAFANRVQWLIDHEVGEARIKLHPPALGAVDVRISMVDDQTFVQLTAATSAARDELASSLPRLRELFVATGLTLGGASVQGGTGGHGGAERGAAHAAPAVLGDNRSFVDETPSSGPAALRHPGRIDLFV